MKLQRLVCFDAESNGLHGEAFAVGGVVLENGREETFYARAPIVGDVDPWVRENVLPALQQAPATHLEVLGMRNAFWSWLMRAKGDGALVVVDCGWPVEASLLSACIADDPRRAMTGPYPLHEVASFSVMAGIDPLANYAAAVLHGRPHRPNHPVDDARVSALCALRAMARVSPDLAADGSLWRPFIVPAQ